MNRNPVKCLVMLLLIAGSFAAQGQYTQRNIFQGYSENIIRESLPAPGTWHPFATTSGEWKLLLPDSTIQAFIRNGENALQENIPPMLATDFLHFTRTKNRSHYEELWRLRRQQLYKLMMAELMEGNGRFCDKIANLIWATCEESFWGLPAHITGLANIDSPYVDLFAAETASLLAWTDYFIGERLDRVSPQVRNRIKSEVDRRMLRPLAGASWWWIGRGDPKQQLNNWSPWIMSNYITVSMLLEKDENRRASTIKLALQTMDQYLNGLGDDGAINEGPVYWFPSVGCVFDALAVLYDASAGRISVYQHPFLRNAASYICNMHIDKNYFVNMGDATVQLDADGIALFRFGKAIGDSSLMAFGSDAARNAIVPLQQPVDRMLSRRFYNLAGLNQCLGYRGKYEPVKVAWMPDIQMMCARSEKGFFLATHGGHNAESHNHNDVGDFVVYLDGWPLLIDVGRGTYTGRTFSSERYALWFNTSGYHNLPEVNGIQQKDGLQYAAREVHFKSGGGSSAVEMDIAQAYPKAAAMQSWKRTAQLLQSGEVNITDHFVLQKPSEIVQHLMTACPADLTEPGKMVLSLPNGNKAVLHYDAKAWVASQEVVQLTSEEDEEVRQSWKGQEIKRLSLRSRQPVAKGNWNISVRRFK